MRQKTLLVTGSSGLIGSEVATHFDALGWQIHGVDNNQRRSFSVPLVEHETRWDYADEAFAHGIPETFRIDASKHPLFGPPRWPLT